jgi:hypothetical protein
VWGGIGHETEVLTPAPLPAAIGGLVAVVSTVLVPWIKVDSVYEPPETMPDGTRIAADDVGAGGTLGAGGESTALPLLVPARGAAGAADALDELHGATQLPAWLRGAAGAVGVSPAAVWAARRRVAEWWQGLVGGSRDGLQGGGGVEAGGAPSADFQGMQ